MNTVSIGKQRLAILTTFPRLPSGPAIIGCPIIIAQTKKRVRTVELLIFLFICPNRTTSKGKKATVVKSKNFISFSI